MAAGKLLPYLDIPFQHASPRILKLMKRPGNIDKTLERINNWRKIVPDLTIRSTFIVGFPGETDAGFDELLDFLREVKLDRVGAFACSPVDGAKANELPDPVSEELKEDHLEQFMAVQAEISAAKLQGKIGCTIKMLSAIDTCSHFAWLKDQGKLPKTVLLEFSDNSKIRKQHLQYMARMVLDYGFRGYDDDKGTLTEIHPVDIKARRLEDHHDLRSASTAPPVRDHSNGG